MKNFLFIVAFLIVLTLVIVSIKPQMHRRIVFGEANIQVAHTQTETKAVETKVTPVQSTTVKNEVEVQKVDNTDFQNELRLKALEARADKEAELKLEQQRASKAENQAEANAKKIRQQQKALEKAIKQAEEQARKVAEEIAKRQAQLEKAKKQAEEQAQKLAQQKAQQEAKKKAEEEAKRLAEQKRLQEEQAKKLVQQKAQEEAKKKAEALAKKQAEEQARKLAEQKAAEEARKKAEAEAEAKKKAQEQKKLVEYQENILWNQWRANVCNNVVNRLDNQFIYVAPAGTVYTYSFDVDKNMRITNINVKISKGFVNTTTQKGIFMIQQAIKSLNLSTILIFPNGSQRTSVKVESGIERTTAQSKSLDAYSFNDVETITKQKYE